MPPDVDSAFWQCVSRAATELWFCVPSQRGSVLVSHHNFTLQSQHYLLCASISKHLIIDLYYCPREAENMNMNTLRARVEYEKISHDISYSFE